MMPETLPLRQIRESRRTKAKRVEDHSLEVYAKRLGISQGQLSRLERGLIPVIPADLAWGLHRVYGVPLKAFDRGRGVATNGNGGEAA